MPDHYAHIYFNEAERYDAMVSAEDYEGHLLPIIQSITSLSDLTVVEFGAGTGRLTRLLLPHVAHVFAFDLSHHMLEKAASRLYDLGRKSSLAVADHRFMPVANQCADVAIAGWTFSSLLGWFGGRWQDKVDKALLEMARVVKPGQMNIIIETLGTGQTKPAPPSERLGEFYKHLETVHGFERQVIRTDYRFDSSEQTKDLIGFFFGAELARRFANATIVPECTGIWYRRV